jgi:hypothetical protein
MIERIPVVGERSHAKDLKEGIASHRVNGARGYGRFRRDLAIEYVRSVVVTTW